MKIMNNPKLPLTPAALQIWPIWKYGWFSDGPETLSFYVTRRGLGGLPDIAELAMPITEEEAAEFRAEDAESAGTANPNPAVHRTRRLSAELKPNEKAPKDPEVLKLWPYWLFGWSGTDPSDWRSHPTACGLLGIPDISEEITPLSVEQAAGWGLGPA